MGSEDGDARPLSEAEVEALYRHHRTALVAYARSLVHDAIAAEDVVQSFFLGFIPLARAGLAVREPLPYMMGGVRNCAFKYLEKKKRKSTGLDESIPASFDAPLLDEQEQKELRDALDILDEDHRRAVMICKWTGFSITDGAALFGFNPKRLSALNLEGHAQLREYRAWGREEQAKARANGPTGMKRLAEKERERMARDARLRDAGAQDPPDRASDERGDQHGGPNTEERLT